MALNGSNNCFMSYDDDGDIVCTSKKAGDNEMITVILHVILFKLDVCWICVLQKCLW